MNRKTLGKGLDALIPDFEFGVPETRRAPGVTELLLDEIVPNRQQPRKFFDDEKLAELVESIREKGVLQPIVVQKSGAAYEIIVGERRWRAARKAGLKKIPVLLKEASDTESLELAIIENIHRQDLNPIEEAAAYARLAAEFGLKQEQIAKRVGRNRVSVANCMRLLKLPRAIQDDLASGRLTMGHARALLALDSEKAMDELRRRILEHDLTVRQTEALTNKRAPGSGATKPRQTGSGKDLFVKNLEGELARALGTKVEISMGADGAGKITVDFYSDEDLERLRGLFVSKIA